MAGGSRRGALDESQTAGVQGYFNDSMVLKFTQDGKFLLQIGKRGQSRGSNDTDNLRLPAKTFVDRMANEVFVADGYGNHRVIVYDADTGQYKRHWGAYGYKPDGTFVKETFINKETLGSGSVWDIAFSRDAPQTYLYLADGENDRVHILDRQSLELLTTFGEGGRQPGEFYGVHSIATDSKGNIFTTETYRGQRVQKFTYKGLGPITKKDQGVVWPKK